MFSKCSVSLRPLCPQQGYTTSGSDSLTQEGTTQHPNILGRGMVFPNTLPTQQKDTPPRLPHARKTRVNLHSNFQGNDSPAKGFKVRVSKARRLRKGELVYSSSATSSPSSSSLSTSMPTSSVVLSPCISISLVTAITTREHSTRGFRNYQVNNVKR